VVDASVSLAWLRGEDAYKKMRAATGVRRRHARAVSLLRAQDFSFYDEMKPVAEDMQRRAPASAEILELAEWAKSRAGQTRK